LASEQRVLRKRKMANNYMKKMFHILAIKEMQVKTTSVRLAIIKKANTPKFWQKRGAKGAFIYC
jgi:hypothetical protein